MSKDNMYLILGLGGVAIAVYLAYVLFKPLKDAGSAVSKITGAVASSADNAFKASDALVSGSANLGVTALSATDQTLKALGGQSGKISPLGVAVVGSGALIGASAVGAYVAPKIASIVNTFKSASSVNPVVLGLGFMPTYDIASKLGIHPAGINQGVSI